MERFSVEVDPPDDRLSRMKTYVFSYYRDEPQITVRKRFFGLIKTFEITTAPTRHSMVVELGDDEVKNWFQGDRFAKVFSKIIGGYMWQLEIGRKASAFIPTTNCSVTCAATNIERTATNVCYPSKERMP